MVSLRSFLLLALVSSWSLVLPAQVLFDAGVGLPSGQGWTFFATGGSQVLENGAVKFDTSAANSYQGGYSRTAPTVLDRTNGFTLEFTLQVSAESHANASRAGTSVILLANDKQGIELGFWTNTIFAQSDSPLFTHAEDAAFVTGEALVTYSLTVLATNYALRADGIPILSGPIRNYEAFVGLPDPYETPNFLFFGDDTTSAGAVMALRKVVLITPPQLTYDGDQVLRWTGVAGQSYTVLASSNLVTWEAVQTVTAAGSDFSYTNSANAPVRFFRVSYP